jgi:hypothetical protein
MGKFLTFRWGAMCILVSYEYCLMVSKHVPDPNGSLRFDNGWDYRRETREKSPLAVVS